MDGIIGAHCSKLVLESERRLNVLMKCNPISDMCFSL